MDRCKILPFEQLLDMNSYFLFQFSLLSLLAGATLENEDEDSDSNSLTTLESLIVTRTNGHGGPSNRSRTILELYQKVSDKENKDQEILLNLIEKSKDSKDRKVERNFVTKKPTIKKPIHQKRQKNSKDIVIEIQKKRRKRKKLIDKIKEKRRPSHMQVSISIIFNMKTSLKYNSIFSYIGRRG